MERNILTLLDREGGELSLGLLCVKYHANYIYGNAYVQVPGVVKKMAERGVVIIKPSDWSWWRKWREWNSEHWRVHHKRVWDRERRICLPSREEE